MFRNINPIDLRHPGGQHKGGWISLGLKSTRTSKTHGFLHFSQHQPERSPAIGRRREASISWIILNPRDLALMAKMRPRHDVSDMEDKTNRSA